MQEVEYQGLEGLLANNVSRISDSNTIPVFGKINQTSLKLLTPDEITSISIGECDISGTLRVGDCYVLDQNGNNLLKLKSIFGIPYLPPKKGNIQVLINLINGYGVCSYNETEFDFTTKEIKSTISVNCNEDKSQSEKFKQYEGSFYKINFPQN